MNNRTTSLGRLAVAFSFLTLLFSSIAGAAVGPFPFTPGNLVVYRVGDGSTALTSAAAPVYLDEYSPSGTLVQSVPMPQAVVGSNKRLTAAGNSGTEGFLTRSVDGSYLLVTGYDTAAGTAAVAGTTSASVNRVVGRVAYNAAVDTSTALTDAASGGNIRGAASTNGTAVWLSSSNAGVRYATLGSTTSSSVTIGPSGPSNTRALLIAGSGSAAQLYVSASTGTNTFKGVSTVGSGVPNTAGQTSTRLPGLSDSATASSYSFFLADLDSTVAGVDTLYIADDSTGAGIQKYSLVSGTWVANGTAVLAATRGLTATVSGSTVTLYVTANGTSLQKYVDSTGYNATIAGSFTSLATNFTNTAFRGVALAPVTPAPAVSSIALVQASPTTASSVDFTVTFSAAVTGVDTSDFVISAPALSGTSVVSVTPVSSSVYTVNVATGSGNGTLRLDVTDDDSIKDGASVPLGGVGLGNGNFSGGPSYLVRPITPAVPSNLVATPGDSAVVLTWDAVSGATSYKVKRATVSGGPYATIAPSVSVNNYTDNAVANGTTYYYVVSAVADLESANSSQVSAQPTPPPIPQAKIYFVDIGQGAATLIVSPTGKSLLVDGGPTGQGNAKLIPLLNALGISTIDFTVLTHYHIDHDDGLTEVISAGRVAGVSFDNGDAVAVAPPNAGGTRTAYQNYINAIAAKPAITRQTITPGTVIDLGGGMRATCLAAAGQLLSGGAVYMSNQDLNSESVSLLVEFNNFDYIVSGDLTGGGSTSTAKTPDVETFAGQLARDVDVVQADHHGSTTANNRRFLKTLAAEIAVAEAGFTNTFGHPNRETANKYLNIAATNGNTYGGTGLPAPGVGPVFYQTDPSPTSDARCTTQGYSGATPANASKGTLLLKTDGTTNMTLESYDDGGAFISPATHNYPLNSAGAGLTANFPPTVVPMISPAVPLSTDTVTVSAQVADKEDAISSVQLTYSINGVAQAPISMTPSGNIYSGAIAAQADATRVDWTVTATAGALSTSYSGGYFAGTTPVATLRQLDALGEPLYYEYAARVTGVAVAGTGFFSTANDDYIQDAAGNTINIWRTLQPTTPAVQTMTTGNSYTVAGLIGSGAGRFRIEVTPPFEGIATPWAPTTVGNPNPYTITQIATGAAPTPTVKTISQLNTATESQEGQLVKIVGCTVLSGTIPTAGGIDGFLTVSDGTGSFQLKIDGDTDIPGLATPSGPFDIIGIIQQDDFLRPFDSGYDIAPRGRVDLGAAAAGPTLITIADARGDVDSSTGLPPGDFVPDRLGQTVKVQGVVTSVDFDNVGNGIEYYIQDSTAGVDIFNGTVNKTLAIGDNVEIIGVVKQFNGLTEIDPGTAVANITVLAPGTLPAVTPQLVTLSQLANGGVGEPYEGKLIRLDNVSLTTPPATFAGNTNYNLSDSTGTGQIRIDGDTNIPGMVAPPGTFSVIAVVGQFDNTSPFDSGYQVLPRMRVDFITPPAASITAIAGTPQSAFVNTAYTTQFVAKVKDSANNPVIGASVTFAAPASGASGAFASSSTVVTDNSGNATAPIFTANGTAGSYNVVATTGALTAPFGVTNLPPPATHFSVSLPSSSVAATGFSVVVTALDASNSVVPGYTGTVHFTSSSTGALPADYSFVAGDSGSHTFSASLNTPGNQSVTVTDTTSGISGSSSINIVLPTLTIANASLSEGTFSYSNMNFSVTLSSAVGNDVSVNYQTTDVSASSPEDYATKSGTLTIPAGSTTGNIPVQITGDALNETDETFTVTLASPVNATIASATATGTIVDDDTQPSISVGDVSVIEGNSGTSNATFVVALSAPSGQAVTFDYATANLTAIGVQRPDRADAVAVEDYRITSGTITIPAGGTSASINVVVYGDTTTEGDEQFALNLSNVQKATARDVQGIGTIIDDDAAPTLSVNDVSVNEGTGGTTAATFMVTLSQASALPVTVSYATSTGSASAADFTAVSGSLTFDPGQLSKLIPVNVTTDAFHEGDETFFLDLSSPSGAGIGDAQGQATIVDDDGVGFTIDPLTTLITSEAGQQASFTIKLNSNPNTDVGVRVSSSDTSEATLSTTSLLFTAANWNVPQTVTATGVDDSLADGNIDFTLVTEAATSANADYNGLDPADVAITNLDNEFAPTVTELTPNTGPAAGGGTINVTGTDFRSGIAFRFGTVPATDVVRNSSTELALTTPSLTAGSLYDVFAENTDGTTGMMQKAFFADFLDVPRSQLFHDTIVAIATHGVTLGCGAGKYCPSAEVTRGQMAAFLARAKAGSDAAVPVSGTVGSASYVCTVGGTSAFTDVRPTDLFCRHIHYVAKERISLGCLSGMFCPEPVLPRDQMAALVSRAMVNGDENVPSAFSNASNGRSYDLTTGNVHFTDMDGSRFTRHAHYLWALGVIDGCAATTYCPSLIVTRDQMSKFLARGFNLASMSRAATALEPVK